ncbi:Ankyrin repeat-containing domain [Phytophthora cactorum]|nr:Ankyrin repeat-containing domain [Phytophthora cactorum]
MAGGDELSTLSLVDEGVQVDEKLDAVRHSVIAGDVEQFLATAGDIGDKSPLVYLMDWLHTWQQEYEAFVHVLGIQEENEDGQEPTETEKDLAEMEAEAEQLMKGFASKHKNPDSVVDRHGWTLLMQAANSGLCELTEELVARKADVNYGGTAKEPQTRSTWLSSAEAGDEDDDADDDDCALFQACRFGHLSVIKEMLALGVDMQEVVELLAGSVKIELNALNESGQTCLFGCSGVEIVKLLVAKGVDPNIKDIDGETALSMAQALGDDEVAEYLETVTQ